LDSRDPRFGYQDWQTVLLITIKYYQEVSEELRDLYSSPSIIRIIESRRMRRAIHVARMGKRGTRIDYWWENQRERDH
jgi:hypothetical protein